MPAEPVDRPALSFGGDAQLYDRARPSYPPEAVDVLVSDETHEILDVGCGTGALSRLLRERGCKCLGVEPDPRMAAVARGHGLQVEDGAFESWDPRGRTFDLVVSGMAWHWIDPLKGSCKAGEALRDRGRFAAMWNHFDLPGEIRRALEPVYERHAPALLGTAFVLTGSAVRTGRDRDAEALMATGHFERAWREEVGWRHEYTTSAWVDELTTRSSHRTLPTATRDALLAEVATAVDAVGGRFEVPYTTTMLRATRRARTDDA